MTQILGENLLRVVTNTIKFVNPKSLFLPGELLFSLTSGTLSCYACDDYVSLTDSATLISKETEAALFVLSLEDAKDLESYARTNKKVDLGIEIFDNTVSFSVNEHDFSAYDLAPYREENWEFVNFLLFEELPIKPVYRTAFRPERFTKFSQLKHDKEAPMDWEYLSADEGRTLVRFKIGETIIGTISALLRDKVDPKYLWEEDELE